ncbi:zinc metalloprotease [Sphingobacterium paucimobilis]|uniref:Uncharacterized protein n=1 Tax=Sphingobacterium paucimobilis HER1398 TaxID=1346330 RepID=U2IYS9_9SPHI|nr:hypothetical protein [Sphingobacterium paucimobilis]ERJ57869.1 hypothetical protein M472_03725 [Sphingobacterium paucimobilis HER1398]ERJ60320.1 hypothetical protein M472_16295 [Sphingobacterium paucimobilis HER1398]
MKKFFLFFIGLILLQGCNKESFNYELYSPTGSDIDSLYFSTGSPTLIANGQAKLQFVVELFRKVRIKSETGGEKDTMMFVDYRKLPSAALKIFVNGQLVDGMEYGTKDMSNPKLDIYAELGGYKSEVKSVQLKEPTPLPVKRYVDVVFHVFDLATTDATYDPLTYQLIQQKHLEGGITYANAVFSNAMGKDPNGGNAQIEFRLAKYSPSGAILPRPGYNNIVYNSTWRASSFFSLSDFTNRINTTSSYQWDKSKYLNIYVLPMTANSSLGNNRANYQIVGAGETPLGGVDKIVVSESEVPQNDFYTTYGLGVHRNVFIPGMEKEVELASYLGTYYGVFRTTVVNDFVYDTRKYNTSDNSFKTLLKVGLDGDKFLANNAMDDIRYPSLRNCFTQGQVDRMRLVMDRSPVRKAWKE